MKTSLSPRRLGATCTLLAGAALLALAGCTQETQNEIRRGIQNWTGTNGVLEIYPGDKLVRRFIQVDKLSTAMAPTTTSPVRTATATACWTRT